MADPQPSSDTSSLSSFGLDPVVSSTFTLSSVPTSKSSSSIRSDNLVSIGATYSVSGGAATRSSTIGPSAGTEFVPHVAISHTSVQRTSPSPPPSLSPSLGKPDRSSLTAPCLNQSLTARLDERVLRQLARLHSAFEVHALARLAEALPSRRLQLVFLINNYDLVATVITVSSLYSLS
ncbi:unnamed protein product [Protopolystoma xenopodis]|uniref:Vps52 C-terminal domain-containing protein n=1 Tax=Protopolystoma xenopodis TaxID=117903 RepID=A0A3S4ZXA5_9PLAT|nr:unnamed protein product [Protopolystoma xenopodis]